MARSRPGRYAAAPPKRSSRHHCAEMSEARPVVPAVAGLHHVGRVEPRIGCINASHIIPHTPQGRPSAYHNCHNLIINSKWTVAKWYKRLVGWPMGLLFKTCYAIATMHLSIRSIVSDKNERYFVPIDISNANLIHNCRH